MKPPSALGRQNDIRMNFRDRIKRFFDGTLLRVNLVFILLLIFSYLSVYIHPHDFWFFALFGIAYPFFLFVNIVFAVVWAVKKKKVFLLPLIVILMGWGHLSNTFSINPHNRAPRELDNTFSFLSYNVRLFDLYEWIGDEWVRDSIYRFILSEDPDIIAIQEYFYREDDPFNETRNYSRLHNRHSHIAFSRSTGSNFNFGMATFSRYPILNRGEIRYKNTSNITIYSDIKINNDTVRVYNNHLQSFNFSREDLDFIDKLAAGKTGRDISGFRNLARRMNQAYKMRSRQVDTLVKNISESPYPVIITGDFNETPVSHTYRRLRRLGLNDAFSQSGSGLGTTYISAIPLFRIDYILHSRILQSYYFSSPSIELSDHYPLQTNFTFNRGNKARSSISGR